MAFEELAILCVLAALVDIGISLRHSNFGFAETLGGDWNEGRASNQKENKASSSQNFNDEFYEKRVGGIVDRHV